MASKTRCNAINPLGLFGARYVRVSRRRDRGLRPRIPSGSSGSRWACRKREPHQSCHHHALGLQLLIQASATQSLCRWFNLVAGRYYWRRSRFSWVHVFRPGILRLSFLRSHREDSDDRFGAVFIVEWLTRSLLHPHVPSNSAANRHHVTFPRVFVRQPIDVSDLQCNWRRASDGPDFFEEL